MSSEGVTPHKKFRLRMEIVFANTHANSRSSGLNYPAIPSKRDIFASTSFLISLWRTCSLLSRPGIKSRMNVSCLASSSTFSFSFNPVCPGAHEWLISSFSLCHFCLGILKLSQSFEWCMENSALMIDWLSMTKCTYFCLLNPLSRFAHTSFNTAHVWRL